MGLSGPRWGSFDLSGPLGLSGSLDLLGPLWDSLGLSETLCAFLGLSDPLWVSLALSGLPWASLNISGPLWLFELLWASLRPRLLFDCLRLVGSLFALSGCLWDSLDVSVPLWTDLSGRSVPLRACSVGLSGLLWASLGLFASL